MSARVPGLGALRLPVIVSLAIVAITAIAVAAPSLLAPGDPLAVYPADAFLPPSLAHPFGTDESGRDLLTRVVHGARASVGIGVWATLIGVGLGAVFGFAAGLGPKLADRALARLFEVLFALPTLVLALLFISVLGGGTTSAVLAIGLATIPGYARLLRARVRGVATSGYVEWARLDGVTGPRLFARHIAPNTLWPLAAAATLGIGQSIVWVASLGFLGLGTAPPAPEWGAMLSAGRPYLASAWWMTVFPGLAIVAIASALTVLGRAAGAPRAARVSKASRAPGLGAGTGHDQDPDPDPDPARDFDPAPSKAPALAVSSLTVHASAGRRSSSVSPVLDGVSLSIAPGECLAIVGESGAGKSVLARTLLGLTQQDPTWRVSAASLNVAGVELNAARPRAWRRVRGTGVALVLQDALQSLDPLRTVETEVGEALAIHGVDKRSRRDRVVAALEAAGLPEPRLRLKQRSHELSGGMRQRALIAAAIAAGPALIIADEPTTALDPVTSRRVQQLFRDIVASGTALLLISHDLASVARTADRVAVLKHGRIVEQGPTARVLERPQHPVTRALVAAIPRGAKPEPFDASGDEPLLRLANATRAYGNHAPAGQQFSGMRGVNLIIRRGEAVGIVGESGAGKTTLARVIIGAERLQSGTREAAASGCRIRLIPQDPLGSFDPRWPVERIIASSVRSDATAQTPAGLLALVGLGPELLTRYPAQLSGGQRQRVAIARALAAGPDVLVCDEAVSALDATAQAGVLELLRDLQRKRGLAIVFVSHDLAAVRTIADRLLVMQTGRVVDEGDTEHVIDSSRVPFTRALVAASE